MVTTPLCKQCGDPYGSKDEHAKACGGLNMILLPDGRQARLSSRESIDGKKRYICECDENKNCGMSFLDKEGMWRHLEEKKSEWLGATKVRKTHGSCCCDSQCKDC